MEPRRTRGTISPTRRWVAASLLALFATPSLPAQLQDAAAIRDRAREIISAGRYQDRLDPEGELPPATARLDRPPEGVTESATTSRSLAPLGEIAKVLLYGLMAIAFVLTVVAAVRAFRLRSAGRGAFAPPSTPAGARVDLEARTLRPDGQEGYPEELLAGADRLAADGRFGEAAHHLLLAAIERLTAVPGVFPTARSPSHTSRELLGLLRIEPERKDSFGDLVRVVETFLFGGRDVSGAAFDRCRRSFETLTAGTGSKPTSAASRDVSRGRTGEATA